MLPFSLQLMMAAAGAAAAAAEEEEAESLIMPSLVWQMPLEFLCVVEVVVAVVF